MKERIEECLKVLTGKRISDIGSAGDIVWISFGELRKVRTIRGGEKTVGEYCMNIQCNLNITQNDHVLLCNEIESYMRDWNSFKYEERIIGKVVEAVVADDSGRVVIAMNEGMQIELSPDLFSATEEELWRFFIPGDIDSHFVVTYAGIEE